MTNRGNDFQSDSLRNFADSRSSRAVNPDDLGICLRFRNCVILTTRERMRRKRDRVMEEEKKKMEIMRILKFWEERVTF